jgi:hypothetical protein
LVAGSSPARPQCSFSQSGCPALSDQGRCLTKDHIRESQKSLATVGRFTAVSTPRWSTATHRLPGQGTCVIRRPSSDITVQRAPYQQPTVALGHIARRGICAHSATTAGQRLVCDGSAGKWFHSTTRTPGQIISGCKCRRCTHLSTASIRRLYRLAATCSDLVAPLRDNPRAGDVLQRRIPQRLPFSIAHGFPRTCLTGLVPPDHQIPVVPRVCQDSPTQPDRSWTGRKPNSR